MKNSVAVETNAREGLYPFVADKPKEEDAEQVINFKFYKKKIVDNFCVGKFECY